MDGCEHAWFEDRGEVCTLLVFVDDATSRLVGLRFARSESTFDYFALTREYLERCGKPVAFYSDKASVFRVNAKDPKAGDGFTQFGRAMHELNIDVMCANTAPAKGRVERAHLTLQDRLVKELRLRGIRSIEEGNAYLPEFMADYNRRFGRAPRNEHDAHRPLLSAECARLDDIFRWREQRKVSANRTLHYNRVLYVLDDTEAADRARGQRVDVYESHEGAVSIRFEGVELAARAFAKDGPALQAPVVDNKLLSAALDYAQQLQRERVEQRLASQRLTLRDRRLLEAQLQELSARGSSVASTRHF